MLTYEDVTGYFLKAASSLELTTHPEYWLNSRSLEREFACTCHAGTCEDVERRSACNISFSWGPLDTALSLDGPVGVCDFFHEADANCPHLHTSAIPPLVLDLSYSLSLQGAEVSEGTLLNLAQMIRLRASEHSKRTIETRSAINMALQDNRLQPDTLTLQQRVELPIWHPDGMHGLLNDSPHQLERSFHSRNEEDEEEIVADNPRPEDWLPQVLFEVCQDIFHVLEALNASVSYHPMDNA